MSIEWMQKRLEGGGPPIIIDGGMGTELEKNGTPMDSVCWSGLAVLEDPKKVRKIHSNFLRAGAEVIITNTYSSGRHMLEPAGAGKHVRDLNLTAVKLAREAIEEFSTGHVALAGSICEWSSESKDPFSKWSKPEYIGDALREQAGLLAEGGVDIIAVEEAQTEDLSMLAIDAAVTTGLPVWVGLSCCRAPNSDHLTPFNNSALDFQSVSEKIIRHATAADGVMLVNVMHTAVPIISEALKIIKEYWGGPVGAYPESGYFKMPSWQFVDVINPEDLVTSARSWLKKYNVRVLGGCCGLGPEHISALRTAFT